MHARVGLVISEDPGHIDAAVRARYDRFADVLADVAGGTCTVAHYLDPLPQGDVLVLSGSYAPWAVHDQGALTDFGARIAADSRPALGVCAGSQLLARFSGGRHDHMADTAGEQGFVTVELASRHPALAGLPDRLQVFHEHTDEIVELPDSLELVASNAACRVQAFIARDRPWWGMQFHPERYDAEHPHGRELLRAFLVGVGI
jgi:GMP synthase-like glutamine amidotransferase